MQRLLQICGVMIASLFVVSLPVLVASASVIPPEKEVPGGFSIAEIKITGSEFIILQNNTGAAIDDLSQYWLSAYNNVSPLAAGVSNSSQQLPAASLDPGGTVLLSASGGATCGAAVTTKLSLSLNDGGGFLEVVQNSLNNGAVVQTAGDVVSWSATASAGIIPGVSSKDPAAMYYRTDVNPANPNGWQLADFDTATCGLSIVVSGQPEPVADPGNQLLPPTAPPVNVVTAPTTPSGGPSLPAADLGLMAPVVNEVFPNPASPQTDANDEFIELYNSNTVPFDLSGFSLQTGSTGSSTTHSYTFPSGTALPAKGFNAFYSSLTNLSLSNSGGRVWLLDPFGNAIGQSDLYDTAKDGQSWVLVNGKWSWTAQPTPGAANTSSAPASKSKTSATSAKKATGSVKGASTTAGAGNSSDANSSKSTSLTSQITHLHPAVLALVGGLALVYALYEYRHDLANRIYQLKRYRAARRQARGPSEGR